MATVEGIGDADPRLDTGAALVLETKLTPPRLRPEHLPRPDLLGRLSEGSVRLTLVAAPPGFGKTTLLAAWAAHAGRRVGWVNVDGDDNDPARFLGSVIAALQRVDAAIGRRALAALRTAGAVAIDVALSSLLVDLAALDADLALVVDDYHLITNTAIHEAVVRLIERAPPGLHLVVATREDPPFPLGRLRARGELLELRAGELRFGDDEAAAFLARTIGSALPPGDVELLQARTEGWPAALYLAALTLQTRPDPGSFVAQFAGDDRYVVDYLTAEVLARLPPRRRDFLLTTSILGRFCAPLADAVTARTDSATMIAALESSNLFLVPLDTTREWYRYHHLFGDVLRHELTVSEPHLVPELHRRASAWFRAAGLILEAVHHATAAGDVEAAAELVARHYATFVDQGHVATVLRWLRTIPEAVAAADWLLCFAGTVVSAHAGELDEAEHWYDLARRAPPREHHGQGPEGALASLAAYLRLLRGDLGASIEHARRALATPTPAVAALGPQMVLASALWWTGEGAEAAATVERVARVAQAHELHPLTVYALGVRAAIALDEEEVGVAAALAAHAIDLMRRAELDEHPWAAMAHIVQGTLRGRRGDLDGAAEEIERGGELGRRQGAWQVTVCASLALAEVRQRQRQPAEARRLLTRVRDLLATLPDAGDGPGRLARTEKLLRLRAGRVHASGGHYWELSPRELDVLRLLPSRLSQREIATELYVSFNTVRTHTSVILRKLGVSSRADAVTRAKELGLL